MKKLVKVHLVMPEKVWYTNAYEMNGIGVIERFLHMLTEMDRTAKRISANSNLSHGGVASV